MVEFKPNMSITIELSLQEAAVLLRLLHGTKPVGVGNSLMASLKDLFAEVGRLSEISGKPL